MRIKFQVLLLLLACPMMAFSQSTLNFPRAFTPADLASTGFAVLNPGSATATVTFTLYGASGTVIATSAPTTIAASGQKPLLGTEIFPTATQAGWVQLTSTTSGLQGFWVGGDFVTFTFTDGADAAPTAGDLVFPLVTTNTELNIANTGTGSNSVSIRIFGANGTELAPAVTQSIAQNGVFQSQASALFSTVNLSNARYIRVTGSPGLTGTAVIQGSVISSSVRDTGVTNAVSVATAGTDANFPHVVSGVGGGGNYTTLVGVTNLGSSSQTVSITFTPESGGSPVTVTRTVAANGSLQETAQSLFNFSAGFQDGWVRIVGSASLTAFTAYADSVAGGFAIVSVQTAPRSSLMFAHIADLSPWLTGLALLNATTSNATVSVYAMNPGGSLIGGAENVPTARFTLNAGSKAAKLLSQLVPQTQQQAVDGGFIFITSTQPLYGIELFFSRTLQILANVAAGNGSGFTPPAVPPAGPFALNSISPKRISSGATLTLTGSGFSTTAANNTVVFTRTSGTLPVQASTATSTSMTVTVPSGAITGAVFVQIGSQTSTHQFIEILDGLVTVIPASPATGIDIVVPSVTPSASTLNVTQIGVGDPGTPIFFGLASVDIGRGQTKQLLLGGSGMSSAAGTNVSLSGDGITIASVDFNQGFVFVTLTVAANAITGPRNIIVTNSNLDTSILSGGVFIR